MLIRARRPDDVRACVDILWSTHREDDYPTVWSASPERFVGSSLEIRGWVAEADGAVVGHVALHRAAPDATFDVVTAATGLPAERLAVVSRLFTAGAHRRRGVGRSLLRHAAAAARVGGRVPVLDVGRTLTPAVALYEHEGWRRVGEHRIVLEQRELDLRVYVGPDPTS